MAYIYSTCIKRDGHPEDCFHWTIESYPSKPNLSYGREILGRDDETEDSYEHCPFSLPIPPDMREHLEKLKPQIDSNCYYPWNTFTEEERERIKKTRPATNQYPVHGRRPTTTLRILDEKESEKDINYWVGQDCWSVYAREHIGLTPTRLFYYHPSGEIDGGANWCINPHWKRKDGELHTYMEAHPSILSHSHSFPLDSC
jgi:hypothetical protein